VELINNVLEIADLMEAVHNHLDVDEFETILRRRKDRLEKMLLQKRRWKRSKNHYDSIMYSEMN
tara:strand:- start:3860 stop:4051 length:192 start_codon:yes stop_codon:yes gene_type:complete